MSSTFNQAITTAEKRITLYGRNTTLEVLNNPKLTVYRVHLASSNRSSQVIADIKSLCQRRDIPIKMHTKQALSRISRNSRQDQGVAIDIAAPHQAELNTYLFDLDAVDQEFLLVDGVTNPQNLGMIIRSIAASKVTGLILPKKGSAKLDPLVYKASAGCLLKTTILHCETVETAIAALQNHNFTLIGLDSHGSAALSIAEQSPRRVFILGNESEGLSDPALAACHHLVCIPMRNEVESLNVAVSAGVIAFRHAFSRT